MKIKNATVAFRVSENLADDLKSIADDAELNLSQLARHALMFALETDLETGRFKVKSSFAAYLKKWEHV